MSKIHSFGWVINWHDARASCEGRKKLFQSSHSPKGPFTPTSRARRDSILLTNTRDVRDGWKYSRARSWQVCGALKGGFTYFGSQPNFCEYSSLNQPLNEEFLLCFQGEWVGFNEFLFLFIFFLITSITHTQPSRVEISSTTFSSILSSPSHRFTPRSSRTFQLSLYVCLSLFISIYVLHPCHLSDIYHYWVGPAVPHLGYAHLGYSHLGYAHLGYGSNFVLKNWKILGYFGLRSPISNRSLGYDWRNMRSGRGSY